MKLLPFGVTSFETGCSMKPLICRGHVVEQPLQSVFIDLVI